MARQLLIAVLGLVLGLMPAAAAEKVVGASGGLTVYLNQGKIIEVDQPLADVFVANPEIADVVLRSPTAVYVFGRAAGKTTIFLTDENGDTVLARSVSVTYDLDGLSDAIGAIYPDGQVSVRQVGGTLIMEGALASPADIQDAREIARAYVANDDQLINRIQMTSANQVNLRVRVAEVSRSLDERVGIDWEALFGDGSVTFGFNGGGGTGASNAFSSALNILTGGVDLNIVIDALAQEGMITILAEPNLTAVSGETAQFLAGGEFPVPVAQDGDTITIEYKQFGVSLQFTPTLLDSNRINLVVAPEVSELDFSNAVETGGVEIPSIATRRASTTVELSSGQSFAIAGLLKSTTGQDIDKLPFLGDVPVLGALFRSNSFRQGESELVIIVTPYIVKPIDAVASIPLPTDGFEPPNELEMILLGKFESETAERQAFITGKPPATLLGQPGFILE